MARRSSPKKAKSEAPQDAIWRPSGISVIDQYLVSRASDYKSFVEELPSLDVTEREDTPRSAYVDAGRPKQALKTVPETLGLLTRAAALDRGRTLRIQAEALHRQAKSLGTKNKRADARHALTRALAVFEDARQAVRSQGAVAEWAEITATLGRTESDLGNLLASSPTEKDREDGIRCLRNSIALYADAFSELKSDTHRLNTRLYLAEALRTLLQFSAEPEDAWLGLSAGIKVLGSHSLSSEYSQILVTLIVIISRSLNCLFIQSGLHSDCVDRTDRTAAALADFIASLGLSETEAAPVLTAALQKLNWSEHLVVSQAGRAVTVSSAATEVVRPSGHTRRKAEGHQVAAGESVDLKLSPSQVTAVVEDLTLGRLRRRYEERLAAIELPGDGFKTKKQAQAAARLATTYRDLRARQVRLGLEPLPKDNRVGEAERMRMAFDRKHKKYAALPSRRRRRAIAAASPS